MSPVFPVFPVFKCFVSLSIKLTVSQWPGGVWVWEELDLGQPVAAVGNGPLFLLTVGVGNEPLSSQKKLHIVCQINKYVFLHPNH